MKIIYPVETLYPNESGGVAVAKYWFLCGLQEFKNIETITITSDFGIKKNTIPTGEYINSECGKVIYLPCSNEKQITFRDGYNISKELLKWIRGADIIHLSSIFSSASIFSFFLSILFRKSKIIWSVHGSVDDVEFKKKKYSKLFVLFLIKKFIKNVHFHTTSLQETKFVSKYLGKKANIKQINLTIKPTPKLNLEKENYFLFIGRFHHKKGIDILLKALSTSTLFLKSKYVFRIAGDYNNEYGIYILNLCREYKLSEKVIFLGSVVSDKKQELISKAYFLFMPSDSENFGIVVAEALSQGTPVVASIYSPWSSLPKYHAGFWVDNTESALREIINQIILMEDSEYQVIAKNTSLLIEKEFNTNRIIRKWVDFYDLPV